MYCEACGRENKSDARFCAGCGSALSRSCTKCDRELAPDASFCDGCGERVGDSSSSATPPTEAAVRKTVTALFCDLVGSTAFGERVDAESSRDAMGRYFEMARSVIEDHGGTVSKFVGDGLLAIFGVPEMAEDDAERAVNAGLALQVGFEEIRRHITERYRIEVGLRVGINTGEVVIAAEDEDIVGDALNTAARLEAACTPGGVLVGEPTWRLTRSVVNYGDRREIRAKGKEELVGGYEVLNAHGAMEEVATPFVGRDTELRQLRLVLEDTILDRTARMVTVIGSPGVGKTRLAREMRAAVDGGTVAFELRCERSGGATFAPISELLRSIAGITDAHTVDEIATLVAASVADLDDSARVAELLAGFVGAAPMRSTEEMFFAVRRLFELMGSRQPLVLVVDDIQWAEPLFLDLLEHLVEWVRTVPLLIVGLARPEIRELRPALTETGRRVATVVNLAGLSRDATSELAAKLVGADSLPRDLLVKIPESTEGNPLFVRELMRMLVDDGVISNASGSWQMVIDIDAVEVPTINSLLASRVERMAPDERRLLELASVVGSEFPVGAIQAAGAEQSRGELELLFERLRRRELIEPTGSYWGDEPVFRFHHVLIRDAAYRRLLKGARAELHVLVGEWTEQTASTLVGEHEVVTAHHFEQAHHYRHQLDLDDYETRALGERAASLLSTAANRALNREDLEAAGSLALRALACIDDQSNDIAELLVLACESLLGTRNVAQGAPLLDRLDEVAGSDRRLSGWVECFRAELTIATDPDGLHDAELRAQAAAGLLEALEDQAGVAKARLQRAAALARLGRVGECEEELDLALTAARAIDDRRRITAILGTAPVAALWGPSPVPRAGGRCLDVVRLLRITTGSPAVEATSVRCQAVLEALRGRYDTARTMLATARDALEELGQSHGLLETELYSGLVELLAQDAVTAEPFLRRAYDGLGQMGVGADAGQAAAHLARALLLQGRIDEAAVLAAESDALAGQNPQTAIISHSVQAEVLAGQGKFGDAIVLAEEAVALGASTDILVDHANAVTSLARVLSAAGEPERAASSAAEAARLFEKKGATVELALAVAESVEGSSVAPGVTLTPGPGEAVQFWNKAHELATGLLTIFVERDEAAYSDAVEADVVSDDRRSLVQLRLDGKRDVVEAAFFSGSSDLGAFVVKSFEPVAVRGDSVVLMSTVIGTVDETIEFALLAVTQWSDEGLGRRIVMFDADDLVPALAELDRLYESELSPIEALIHSEFVGHNVDTAAKDIDGIMSRVDPSLVLVDHRQIGWPSTDDGWTQLQQRVSSLFESVESVVAMYEKIHRSESGSVLYQHRYVTVMADGAAPSQRDFVLAVTNPASGYTKLVEQFDELDVDLALRRFDELAAAWTTLDTSSVVRVGGAVNVCVRSGKHDRLESFVAPDFALEDSEGDEVVGDDLVDLLRSVGFGGPDRIAVAVRCGRLALIDVGLEDGTRLFLVEELNDSGLLVRIRQFQPDQLREAFRHLERRWTDIDSSIPADLVGPIRRFVDAIQSASSELLNVLHEDFESIDHRVLGMMTLDRPEFIEGTMSADTLGYCPVEQIIHRTSKSGFVASGYTAIVGEPLGEVVMNPHLAVVVFDDSLVRWFELFPDDQLDVALARLDGPEHDHPSAVLPIDLTPDLANTATKLIEQRWADSGLVEVLAVRFDDHALAEVTAESESFFVLLSVPAEGDEPDQQRFAGDSLPEAMRVLDRRWIDGLGSSAPEGLDTVAAFVTALNPPDPEALAALYAPDVTNINHASLFQLAGAETHAEQVSLSTSLHVDGDSIISKVNRVADHLALTTFDLSNRRPDGGRWVTSLVVLGREHGGRVDYRENWDIGDMALANARFDELADELSTAAGAADSSASLDPVTNAASQAFGQAERDDFFVVAVRDQLALLDVVTGTASRQYIVVEVDQSGQIVARTEFEATELHAAMECIDSRWLELLPDMAPKNGQSVLAMTTAMRSSDSELLAPMIEDEFVSIDHRKLGFGQLDRDTWLNLVTAPSDDFGVLVARSIHRCSDSGFVASFMSLMGHEGDDLIEINVFVTVVMVEDGKLWRVEAFAEDQIEAALARFDELASGSVTEEPVVPTRSLEVANAVTSRFALERPDDDFEVVSVLDQNDALLEVRYADGPEFLSVALTSDGELTTRSYGDRLIDGIEGSYRGWISTLDERQQPTAKLFMQFGLAHHPPVDGDRMASLLADDFEVVAHNQLGALDNVTVEEKVAGMVEASDVVGVAIVRKLVAYSDHVMLSSMETTHEFAGSDRWGNRVLVLVLERDGKVAFQEQWDDEDLDAALARFDELAGQATTESITNLAVETMVSAVNAINAGDHDALKSLMHTDLDFVNHGVIGSPGGSSQQLFEAATSVAESGERFKVRPVAVMGERLAVLVVRIVAANGFFTERVVSFEVDGDALAVVEHQWDIGDLRLGLAHCRRRHLATEEAHGGAPRRWAEADAIANESPSGLLETDVSDGFEFVDRRPNSILGAMDCETWIAFQEAIFTDHPQCAHWIDVIDAVGDLVLRRVRRWPDPTVPDPAWDFLTVEFWPPTGLERVEAFDLDQKAEARARLAELDKVHGESLPPTSK